MARTRVKRYGTVEDKVHRIVRMMGEDCAYLFKNWPQVNVSLDDVTKPSVVYMLPASGKLNISYARVKDAPETNIFFLCPTDFDFNGHVNDNIVERMKRLCIKFIKTLNESGLFEVLEGELEYQVVYDARDQNVTGIGITPILKEVEGVAICDDIARDEDEVEQDEYEEEECPCACE